MPAEFPVILFYKYVAIADPAGFVASQRELCSALGLKGRILIATEGINGTLAGPRDAVDRYVAALRADQRFSDLEIKISPGDAKRALEEDPEVVVVDVRNRYESTAGKFANAIACDIEHFRELPGYVE